MSIETETLADRVGFLVDRGYGQVMFSFDDEFAEHAGELKAADHAKVREALTRYSEATQEMFDSLADLMNLVGATSTLAIEERHGKRE